MPKYAEELYWAILLNLKGIRSNSAGLLKGSYKSIKTEIKNRFGLVLDINTIEEITVNLSSCIFEQQLRVYELVVDGPEIALSVLEQQLWSVKTEIESLVSREISDDVCLELIKLLVSNMRFTEKDFPSFFLKNRLPCDHSYAFENISTVKQQLDVLFKRTLSQHEFSLMLESWCKYMYLARDLNDNIKFKEQIKEIQDDLKSLEKHINSEVMHLNNVICKLNCFQSNGLEHLKAMKVAAENNLISIKRLRMDMQIGNGKPLNKDALRKNGFFAILFCAETFGLCPSETHRQRNPFIQLLNIFLGWNLSGGTVFEVNNKISQHCQDYMEFKNQSRVKAVVQELIKLITESQHSFETIYAANLTFQSILLPVNLAPVKFDPTTTTT